MNPLLFPTVLAGILLFLLGFRIEATIAGKKARNVWILAGLLLALPALAYATYYTRLLGEPLWLYRIRSAPLSELAASGAGFFAGFLQGIVVRNTRLRKTVGLAAVPATLVLLMVLPHLKPLLRRPMWEQFAERWSDGVCLQSSASSCGPACAATLLRLLNKRATELEIAREAFTSSSGTENWYLIRALRRRGVIVEFIDQQADFTELPFPSLAGVHVEKAGHFITVLGREGGMWIIGDPLVGRQSMTISEFRDHYQPTGFFIVVKLQ